MVSVKVVIEATVNGKTYEDERTWKFEDTNVEQRVLDACERAWCHAVRRGNIGNYRNEPWYKEKTMHTISVKVTTVVTVDDDKTYEDTSTYVYVADPLETAVLDACEQAGWHAVRYGNASLARKEVVECAGEKN